MNKRQTLASLNKIANELDNNGLLKEANILTNVMKRLAEEDDSEKQDPFSMSNLDTNINDPEYHKKMFIVNARKPTWEFVNYINALLREKGFQHNPSMWQTILEMISLNYSPDMLDVNNDAGLNVLNDIWSKFQELGDETVTKAYLSEELSEKTGLPQASDEQNKNMREQYSTLKGMVLVALKEKMRSSARIDIKYMSNADLVDDHSQPAYTSKYSLENVENLK